MSGSVQRRKIIPKIGEGSSPGHLLFNDFYNRPDSISTTLSSLVTGGALVQGDKGKLKLNIRPLAEVSPWYHVRRTTARQCGLWHDICFKRFNFVHSECLRCWKTVFVTDEDPSKQTVQDLFIVRDILKSLDMPSKCGCDVRLYTPHRYATFIYGDSLEEGQMYYELAKDNLLSHYPAGKVILKLACTEFEHHFGPTDTWEKFIPTWKNTQDYLRYFIEPQSEEYMLSLLEHTDADTFRFWIEYAHGVGDLSWNKALKSQGYELENNFLFDPPTTYHKEE